MKTSEPIVKLSSATDYLPHEGDEILLNLSIEILFLCFEHCSG